MEAPGQYARPPGHPAKTQESRIRTSCGSSLETEVSLMQELNPQSPQLAQWPGSGGLQTPEQIYSGVSSVYPSNSLKFLFQSGLWLAAKPYRCDAGREERALGQPLQENDELLNPEELRARSEEASELCLR